MSPFARLGLGAGSTSRRLFLGLSGSSLGIYYASTFRKVHADSDFQSRPQQGNRETYSFKPHVGVHRVDTVFWPANYPAEDVLTSLYVQPMSWSFWSVYDGHVGPQAAWHLEKHLLPNLAESLHTLYSKGVQPHTEAIYSTIKNVFVSLDDEMVKKSAQLLLDQPEGTPIRALAARALQTARAGSCALVAFYDKNVRTLHISLTGDSRALLGRARKAADGKTVYDVQLVSADQNGLNPAEVARLSAEHPGEELFKGSRYMGWGLSRSFGNGVMKWSRELQSWMKERCLGNTPRDTLLTPPYFTAEPEITSTTVEPGDFLVMASDGLWDCLTNEEVVGLVGLWLERNENVSNATPLPEEEQAIERAELPVTLTDSKTHYPYWPTVKKRFVNVDSNVARHLARNALGGADKDLHVALLSTPSPRARHVRDDVSAIVVFFE
ncbi:protein serine threonine phosphatase 2C [Mycena albidolilacea]|uniref:Protein serine threonine phosphatase 2C n=1 Tax=Mycena albidolilacea TaxID=1033008 RepID=A0AAD7EBY0_9AGAR|nr:protein serine threonine phosphatase 2C [Mycena albidolilacea]